MTHSGDSQGLFDRVPRWSLCLRARGLTELPSWAMRLPCTAAEP
jgi:hypothetical protein